MNLTERLDKHLQNIKEKIWKIKHNSYYVGYDNNGHEYRKEFAGFVPAVYDEDSMNDMLTYIARVYQPPKIPGCYIEFYDEDVTGYLKGFPNSDGIAWAYSNSEKEYLVFYICEKDKKGSLRDIKNSLYLEAYITDEEGSYKKKLFLKPIKVNYTTPFKRLANQIMKELDNHIKPIAVEFSKRGK